MFRKKKNSLDECGLKCPSGGLSALFAESSKENPRFSNGHSGGIVVLWRERELRTDMKISINGETAETSAKTLAELAKELGLPERGVAVAAENRVVPRTEWVEFPLRENLPIVVVRAACGG